MTIWRVGEKEKRICACRVELSIDQRELMGLAQAQARP